MFCKLYNIHKTIRRTEVNQSIRLILTGLVVEKPLEDQRFKLRITMFLLFMELLHYLILSMNGLFKLVNS